MASRFWVGGTGNWDAADTTHWAASSNGAGGQSVPGGSDTVTFDASSGGGTVTVTADHTVVSVTGGAFTGTLNYGTGRTVSYSTFNFTGTGTRTLTLGNVSITITGASTTVWDVTDTTNLTFSGASSTITLSGASAIMTPGASLSYGTVNFTGSGAARVNSTATSFVTLTRTGTNAKTDTFLINGTKTVTTTLTLAGNSSINRLQVLSNTVGTVATITNTTTTLIATNVDFQDIGLTVTKDFSAQTDIGDCGGNSGITFPASVTQTWNGASGGNWSTNAWTTRVPLPQDDVSLGVAFSASQTVTADMPRLGRSIDWTGATGSPTWGGSTAVSVYGSVVLISGMTVSLTNSFNLNGRGNFTFTSAGKQFGGISMYAPTGTYTLNDALDLTGGNNVLSIQNGTFNANGFNISSWKFESQNATTRTINIENTLVSLTRIGAFFQFESPGLTLFSSGSNIVSTGASATTRSFLGGGYTYGTLTYTVAGSTGELDITGSNSFAQINFSDASNARSLKFTAGTTTTIRNGNGFNVRGTAGKLMTIDTITGASTFTLTSSSVQSTDYITPTRSTVNSSPKWYAGANSTDGTGNTNWLFQAGYAQATGTSSLSLYSLEYSAYANVNGVGSLTLAEQKLKYFTYKLGYTPASVRDGEIAFLRSVTNSSGTDLRAMWNRYATSLGQPSLNTEEEIKRNVFLNVGLPY